MFQFKNKANYYLVFIGLFWGNTYSQTQKLPDFAMQTPQAAALSKYSEYPVGSFTGIPSINVPLYTIECGDISFPIGLNYHAGGFKVTEEASWVGLGWTLTANGAITKTVNGADDFYGNTISKSYNTCQKILDIVNEFPCTDIPKFDPFCTNNFNPADEKVPNFSVGSGLTALVDGKPVDFSNKEVYTYDWEPDVYSINIMGINGKFVLDQDKNVYFIDKQDIEVKKTDNGWMARSNDGFQYYFEQGEATYNYNGLESLNGSNYITKIVSPTKREMKFFYDKFSYPDTSFQMSYSETNYRGNYSNYNNSRYDNVYLKKIEFDNGYVVFTRDANIREDIKNSQRLKKIQVYNKSDLLIKEFELTTSYFNTNDNTRGFTVERILGTKMISDADFIYYQKRLKLDKVIERNGTLSKNTVFNYSTLNLPNKDSFSQDHWGYYNGRNNHELIPFYQGVFPFTKLTTNSNANGTVSSCGVEMVNSSSYYSDSFGGSANRESNPETMNASILKEIIYPTGGKTSFEFEPNDCTPYGKDAEEYVDFSQSITRESRPNATDITTTTIDMPFTIPSNFGVYAPTLKFEVSGPPPLIIDPNISAKLEWINFTKSFYKNSLISMSNSLTEVKEFTPIPNGPVTLSLNIPELDKYQNSMLTFSCKLKTNNFSKKYVGGLRVKKIVHTDGINIDKNIVKKYAYLDDFTNAGMLEKKSSGILKSYVKYWTEYLGDHSIDCGSKIGFSSSIKNGLTLSQYSHIGYGKITESLGENGEYGATQYIYYNLPNLSFSTNRITPRSPFSFGGVTYSPQYFYYNNTRPNFLEDIVPPGVPYTVSQGFDGKLKSKIHFDNGTQAVQYEYYDYEKLSEKVIKSIAQRANPTVGGVSAGPYYNIVLWYYPIFSRWEPMVSSQKGIFNKATNSYTETTSAYEYNPENLLPSKTTTFDSNTNKLITKNYYATDVTNTNYTTVLGESLSVAEYNALNQLKRTGDFKTATPIQVETYKNTDLLSRQRTIFNTFGNLTLPNALKTAKTTNVLETRIAYNKYDDKGNPLELQLTGGTTVAYIWGYNKTLPVAKIENATYAQVEALMGGAGFVVTDGLSATQETALRTGLPNAMVTTYTHIPLVGVSTITDPKGDKITYEYDGFNRLKWVLDKNGNKLSENEYHYKN
jgi:hypothetical protein